MNNENDDNVYNNHEMSNQEIEEQKNYNVYTNRLFVNNYNINILDYIDNFQMLFNINNEYNIVGNVYEDIEEKMISIATMESENSYNSHERNPECIINIKSLKFKDCKHKENICTICISEYKSEDKVSILKCNHIYHNKCILEWGMYRQECPMCRESIEIKNGVNSDTVPIDIKEDTLIEDKILTIIIETNCSRGVAIKTLRDCNEEINVSIQKIIDGYNSVENDTGIECNDIETVMNYGSCSRDEAIRALKEYGNVVEAIVCVTR
jgi:NACalpha-BTF3-like transcription factor